MKRIKLIVLLATLLGLLSSSPNNASAAGETELPVFNTLSNVRNITRIAVSPDGSLIFMADNPQIWHLESGRSKKLSEISLDDVYDAAFSPDGTKIAVSDRYNGLNLFDSQSGKMIDTFTEYDEWSGRTNQLSSRVFAFSNDSKFLIVADEYRNISIIDLASHNQLIRFNAPDDDFVLKIQSHPKRNEFVIATSTKVHIRNTGTGDIIKSLQLDGTFSDLSYSPDGRYLVISFDDVRQPGFVVLDAQNGYMQIAEQNHTSGSVSFNKDSSVVVIGGTVFQVEGDFKDSYDIRVKNSDKLVDPDLALLTPDGKYLITRLMDSFGSYVKIDQAALTVLDASALLVRLTGIEVEPGAITFGVNDLQELKLMGIYSDGTRKKLKSENAEWSVKDFYVAEIEDSALIGRSYGTTTLSVKYSGLTSSVPVNVAEQPTNLKAEMVGQNVKLTWKGVKNSKNLQGYYLYRRTANGNYSKIPLTDFPLKTTEFIDSNIESKQSYVYICKAVYNDEVESAPSNEAKIVPHAKIVILEIDNPMMKVNGKSKELDPGNGTTPVVHKGRTLLPIKALVNEFGGTLNLSGSEQKITIRLNDSTIELWINSSKAIVNGVEQYLDVAPTVINGRTMLPLRFIGENLGLKLNWNANSGTITLHVR